MNRPILTNVLPTLLGAVRSLLSEKADKNEVVKSVNSVLPDQNGNVEISGLPEGGVPGDILVRTEDSAEWVTPVTDDDIVDTLLAADLLPAVTMNGAVLRDGTGKIVLI